MKYVSRDASGLPGARVMLFDQDGSGGDIFHGTWKTLPWGMDDDECCAVTLESGQSLHVWLEGLTDCPAEERLIKLGHPTALPPPQPWAEWGVGDYFFWEVRVHDASGTAVQTLLGRMREHPSCLPYPLDLHLDLAGGRHVTLRWPVVGDGAEPPDPVESVLPVS